ncbi:hypothetical protein [Hamadaea tsunoensis]|uniref:hypothetical protein n=1 Tax=Hamadaea tsunoensis TaxID=53368 RepID=UPI000403763A|nr:hypothetical protein [Hamadaea tsunoensis]
MSTTKSEQKYATAVYAAAGLGDLAVEQLRKLPALAGELRERAEKLREQAPTLRAQATGLTGKVEVDRIRTVVLANAQKAADVAVGVYGDLVARGTKVIDKETPVETVPDFTVPESAAEPAAPAAKPVRKPKTAK